MGSARRWHNRYSVGFYVGKNTGILHREMQAEQPVIPNILDRLSEAIGE